MSTVTPSEGYNSHIMKHFTELEDQLKKDHARARENLTVRADELEKQYREAIQQNEEKSTEAVEDIRKTAMESSAKSRESDRAEIERLSRKMYDASGRNRSNEADGLAQQLKNTIESAENQHKMDSERMKDIEKSNEANIEDLGKEFEGRVSIAAEKARDSALQSYSDSFEMGRSADKDYRSEAKRRYDELNRARLEDQQEYRRTAKTVIADSERDLNNRNTHQDTRTDQRLAREQDQSRRRIEEATAKLNASHEGQTRELRDKIQELSNGDSGSKAEIGKARAEFIREQDSESRAREDMIQDNSEKEQSKLREVAKRSEEHLAKLGSRNVAERDVYYSKVLARNNAESHTQQKDLEKFFETNTNNLEKGMKKERERAQSTQESLLRESAEQRREALEKQAGTYQRTIASQSEESDQKIEGLEKELKRKNTTSDPNEISPAAESAVRRSVTREYEKNFEAESDRNKRAINNMQRNFSGRLQNLNEESKLKLTTREQQNQAERRLEQARFLDHVTDTENLKTAALRAKEGEHERQMDLMNRSFNQMSTRLKNEYESMFNLMRDDAQTKLSSIRQETDFQAKTTQRAFTAKQNELIRDYEKKLADQKAEFAANNDDMRTQLQHMQRDGERKTKTALEEMSRSYEQRLATTEAQQQERERTITQKYEDELEKVKRANGLLKSKKS